MTKYAFVTVRYREIYLLNLALGILAHYNITYFVDFTHGTATSKRQDHRKQASSDERCTY